MLVVLLGCGPAPTAAAPGSPPDAPAVTPQPSTAFLTVVDGFLEAQMRAARVPGLAAAVVVGDEVVWTGAYGLANVEEGRPVEVGTPFQLASVSKTVIAVAILQQVEAGLLDLDADIDTVLPFAVDVPSAPAAPITLRHLMTHTSAIRDRWPTWGDLYVPGDSPVALGAFLRGYLDPAGEWYHDRNFVLHGPGEVYDYSNVGASLAAQVLESAIGTDFREHCKTHVFGPLGLAHTGWRLADLDASEVAVPYVWNGTTWESYGLYGYPDYPDGLLRASVADVARFMTVFTGSTGGGLLAPATVRTMLEEQVPEVVSNQGLILYRQDSPVGPLWGHGGSDLGVSTEFRFDPVSGVGVVLLMNGDWYDTSAVQAMEDFLFVAAAEL